MYLGNLTIYVTWWDKLPIDTENPGDLLLQHPLTVHYFFTPLGWLYAAWLNTNMDHLWLEASVYSSKKAALREP